MSEKDLMLFLRAKKESLAVNILLILSMFLVCSIVVLDAASIEHDYTIFLAIFSSVFLIASVGTNRWVTVSRDRLLSIIQRQIDDDPTALQKVSQLQNRNL